MIQHVFNSKAIEGYCHGVERRVVRASDMSSKYMSMDDSFPRGNLVDTKDFSSGSLRHLVIPR